MIKTNFPLFVNKETGNIEEFFNGSVIDLTGIFINDLDVGILTTRKLNVGVGGTIITAGYGSSVGIGSTQPEQRLDINGSVKIGANIFDSANSPGENGYYLNRDANGIRWISVVPSFTEGIFVQDDGTYIPIVGAAQSFTVLNFKEINSLGIGTTTITPIPNPNNPTFIADIRTQDFWGYSVSGDIYRMTKVGIQNNNPSSTLDITGTVHATGAVDFDSTLNVDGVTTLNSTLDVDGASIFNNTIELNSTLIDINGSVAAGKTDYRLSSVGTGVSWRPSGVQTQNAIWVTLDGIDTNSGYLEGDAKRTIGAAASVAEAGDTIFVRSGVYFENNPIGLRTDVSISGQDLRLVTIVPQNIDRDIFHVRRGCLIENLNFSGSNVSIAHTGCSTVAFPPTNPAKFALSGFIASGPATEGPSGRWRSPYIRNCTNFITKSIGMKIDGDHATASNIGADLKSMVCDSFTQYNENGIGVSITNNGYAQLVSIFTINCDIGIYVDSGGNCDLTNSNSSFGNFGLVAVGLGSTEFTGIVSTFPSTRTEPGVDAGSDKVTFANMKDSLNVVRRPYDGQALFFKINLNNYPDAQGSGIISEPMVDIKSITVTNGGTGYSAATPPTVIIRDISDLSQQPKGPQGIIAEVSPTVDEISGAITSIGIVNSGRNYLSTQNLEVFIDGTGGATATVLTQPILFTIDSATPPSSVSGITTVTLNQFIPYTLFGQEQVSLKRISRILTSSHSFEYIGTGTSINTSTPFQGGVAIKDNEIVALDGAQIPFTSTDQKGNFNIGEGLEINQPTASIRGRDFSKAIQAEVTPLILALR